MKKKPLTSYQLSRREHLDKTFKPGDRVIRKNHDDKTVYTVGYRVKSGAWACRRSNGEEWFIFPSQMELVREPGKP